MIVQVKVDPDFATSPAKDLQMNSLIGLLATRMRFQPTEEYHVKSSSVLNAMSMYPTAAEVVESVDVIAYPAGNATGV